MDSNWRGEEAHPLPSPAQFQLDHALHLGLGGRFAGPKLELARALLDEHLQAGDDRNAARLGQLEQRRLQRVVDHVEDQTGVEFILCDGQRRLGAGHAAGRGVDEHIKAAFGELLALERVGLGLLAQGRRRFRGCG